MTTFQRTGHSEQLWIGRDVHRAGVPVQVDQEDVALALLRDVGRDAWGWAALRRTYAEAVGQASICKVSDQAVLEGLVRRLVTGELKVRSLALPAISVDVGALLPVPAPPPTALKLAPPPQETPPIAPMAAPPLAPAPQPDDVVQGIEAAALVKAASEGIAFCEECERRKNAA